MSNSLKIFTVSFLLFTSGLAAEKINDQQPNLTEKQNIDRRDLAEFILSRMKKPGVSVDILLEPNPNKPSRTDIEVREKQTSQLANGGGEFFEGSIQDRIKSEQVLPILNYVMDNLPADNVNQQKVKRLIEEYSKDHP